MRNTLGDLNNHLFAQLEKLGDDELKGTDLDEELRRTDLMIKISQQIINNGNLVLKARQLSYELQHSKGEDEEELPPMLQG